MSPLRHLVRKEVRASLRGYWFLAYSGVLIVGGLTLVAVGGTGGELLGSRGYARGLAGLAHLCLAIVPLMALFPAATSLAGERESGALEYLLAQPIERSRLYAGKWLGVSAAVLASLAIAYGAFGAVAVLRGVRPALILGLLGATALLAVCFVSLGLCVSAVARSSQRAMSLSVAAWLVFLALGSLGVIGAFIRWGLPREALVAWSLLNPIEACRLAILPMLDNDPGLLGPVGSDLVNRIGRDGIVAAAGASMLMWAAIAAAAGRWLFEASGD